MGMLQEMTLAEIRGEVLKRAGFPQVGNQATSIGPTVDSHIRSADRMLFMECQWLRKIARVTIALTPDTHEVDWPDDAEPGKIITINVLNTSGKMFPVGFGARSQERDTGATTSGRPIVAEYVDSVIRLWPAPTSTYPSLIVDYVVRSRMVGEGDRASVDSEAVIQLATFLTKADLEIPVTAVEAAWFERYLAAVKTENTSAGGFQMGGHQSLLTFVRKVNRVAADRKYLGDQAPFASDWNPF